MGSERMKTKRNKICINCKSNGTVRLTNCEFSTIIKVYTIRLYCSKCKHAYTVIAKNVSMTVEEVDG